MSLGATLGQTNLSESSLKESGTGKDKVQTLGGKNILPDTVTPQEV